MFCSSYASISPSSPARFRNASLPSSSACSALTVTLYVEVLINGTCTELHKWHSAAQKEWRWDCFADCQASLMGCQTQACDLGLDVSVSRPSRDVSMSLLDLVSTKIVNVPVSSRSRKTNVLVSSRSRPLTSHARDQFSTKFCRSQ